MKLILKSTPAEIVALVREAHEQLSHKDINIEKITDGLITLLEKNIGE